MDNDQNFTNHNFNSDCSNLKILVDEMTINDGNSCIIPSSEIKILRRLGSGEFGVVQEADWIKGEKKIQVAVKCLTQINLSSNPTEFIKEARIMHAIDHENIVRLFGIVLDGHTQMLVTELASMRSLSECLKNLSFREIFSIPTLCKFSLQICKGMEYLESKRLIHRDLAARNILVFNNNKVKISDFGLSRALSVGKTYYQTNFSPNLKLPIAWCAPESINFLRFTTSSDVYSYGVCLWEMFSYGMQPWHTMTGQQILEAIDEPNFRRLEKPEYCPDSYYSLLLKCWSHDPLSRPTFSEIATLLPTINPIQVKALVSYHTNERDMLKFSINDIITVLDTNSSTIWKGVLNNGKIGMFDPKKTDYAFENEKKHQHKGSKKKSIFSKVLNSPSTKLKFDTTTNDTPKHQDQEHLLPLTPNSPDSCQAVDNEKKNETHFKFFPTKSCKPSSSHRNCSEFDEGQSNNLDSKNEVLELKNDEQTLWPLSNVRLISPKDQKILDQALEIAYKCSTGSIKSSIDVRATQTKRKKNTKRKQYFQRKDVLHNLGVLSKDHFSSVSQNKEGRNFSEELKEKSELVFTDQSKEAYENLVQNCRKEVKKHPTNEIFSETTSQCTTDIQTSRQENISQCTLNNQHILELPSQIKSNYPEYLPPKPEKVIQTTKRHVRIHPLVLNCSDSLNVKQDKTLKL